MDSGELEFYQHAKVCSNTCRSTKIDPAASKVSAGSQMPAEHVAAHTFGSKSVSSSDAEDGSEWVTAIAEDSVVFWCGVKQAGLLDEVLDDFREKLKDMLTSMQERVSQPPLLPRVKLTEEVDVESDIFYPITCGDTEAILVWRKFMCPGINVKCIQMRVANGQSVSSSDAEDGSEWVTAIAEDSVVFWCGVKQAGLLDEVLDDFREKTQGHVDEHAGEGLQPPLLPRDVILLNDIVQNFGMLDLLKKVLAGHKSQMDQCREQYTQSLAGMAFMGHSTRAKEMKSRAQHLDHVLMTLSPAPAPSPPAPKHPRLSRRVSTPAIAPAVAGIPSPAQMTLSLNPLAGLPLGNVLTFPPPGAGAQLSGGYTVLTSPVAHPAPGGGQPSSDGFPAHLTVLSTAAPGLQEGNGGVTFLKVLGPQYQLVTLPPASQGLNGVAQNAAVQLVVANGNNNSNMALHAHLMPEVRHYKRSSALCADTKGGAAANQQQEQQQQQQQQQLP
ncbi:hypothetical protein CRUP_002132 [Coryphaenoides rupestris]|nr:hypothetical protein CRUP_002132 [Coryphaenoides rupestris]